MPKNTSITFLRGAFYLNFFGWGESRCLLCMAEGVHVVSEWWCRVELPTTICHRNTSLHMFQWYMWCLLCLFSSWQGTQWQHTVRHPRCCVIVCTVLMLIFSLIDRKQTVWHLPLCTACSVFQISDSVSPSWSLHVCHVLVTCLKNMELIHHQRLWYPDRQPASNEFHQVDVLPTSKKLTHNLLILLVWIHHLVCHA